MRRAARGLSTTVTPVTEDVLGKGRSRMGDLSIAQSTPIERVDCAIVRTGDGRPSQLGIDSCCYQAQDWVASAFTWVKSQGFVGALSPDRAGGRPSGHVNVA